MRKKPIGALVAACLALLAAAPAGATKYAAEFLKIPVGARAVGMGGAFAAVADDATSPFWNPAGMVYLPYKEAFRSERGRVPEDPGGRARRRHGGRVRGGRRRRHLAVLEPRRHGVPAL